MGAELLGDASPEADAEMLAMLVEALRNAGLQEFQVSVGQIEYFKGLCANAALDEETELALREFISNRNEFGAQELLLEKNIPADSVKALLSVNSLFGTYDILDKALACADNQRSRNAIMHLKQVYELLKVYGVDQYISFDLAMVSKYNYYTGIIFSAYTYQAGSAIAKGGRYDNLLEKFGKPAPATGFVVMIDDLVSALTRQKCCPALENNTILLVYTDDFDKAVAEARAYRAQNYATVLMKQEQPRTHYTEFAENHHISQVIFL